MATVKPDLLDSEKLDDRIRAFFESLELQIEIIRW